MSVFNDMFLMEEGDCNTGSMPGMSFLEVLRAYPTARAELFKLVPEIVEDIQTKWKNSDPRDTFAYNHDINIVILRPSENGHRVVAGTGQINTKHVYYAPVSGKAHGFSRGMKANPLTKIKNDNLLISFTLV